METNLTLTLAITMVILLIIVIALFIKRKKDDTDPSINANFRHLINVSDFVYSEHDILLTSSKYSNILRKLYIINTIRGTGIVTTTFMVEYYTIKDNRFTLTEKFFRDDLSKAVELFNSLTNIE